MTTSQAVPMSETAKRRLAGNLGTNAIIFMVVAAAAPLAVIGGVLPVGALTGNGAGMPSMFLLDGVVLMFFAVGLATMSRFVPKPGEFFTMVGYGLGRPGGVAAAWLALLTYVSSLIAVLAYLGMSLGTWVDGHAGVQLPWWLWTLGLIVLVGVLGYRQVNLSAKVLGALLVVEVAIVLAVCSVIVFRGGANGLSSESFHPSTFMSGSPALALMWGMAGYSGFESTVIYRDEARNPARTVPRATYGALLLIAVFYTFSSWALVQGWGAGFGREVAKSTSNFMVATSDRYLGAAGAQVVNVLLLTSFFATALAFHNVITRYLHTMANAGLLARRVGAVHESQRSPYIASVVLSVMAFSVISLFALLHMDPYLKVYTWFGGVGTTAIVVLLAYASVAIIVYLNRQHLPVGWWKRRIAPSIGLVGLTFIAILLFKNFPTLLGDADPSGRPRVGWLSISFYALMVAFPTFGLAQAYWLRSRRPATYAKVLDRTPQIAD